MKTKSSADQVIESAIKIANSEMDIESIGERRKRTVQYQLEAMFKSFKDPNKTRVFTDKGSRFAGTEYEPVLQDMLARGYQTYTIKRMLKQQYGKKSFFTTRAVLGYIKHEILNKVDNLELIADLKQKYSIDREDAHDQIENSVKEKRQEIKNRIKIRRTQLARNIDDLYARIEIMKSENRKRFSSTIENQIASNYELIEKLEDEYKNLTLEQRGVQVDAELIRAETIKVVLAKCINHMLPHIERESQAVVLNALKIELQTWVNSETKLNKLEAGVKQLQSHIVTNKRRVNK